MFPDVPGGKMMNTRCEFVFQRVVQPLKITQSLFRSARHDEKGEVIRTLKSVIFVDIFSFHISVNIHDSCTSAGVPVGDYKRQNKTSRTITHRRKSS